MNAEPSSLLLAPALTERLLAMFSEGAEMRLQHLATGFVGCEGRPVLREADLVCEGQQHHTHRLTN